MTTEFNQNDNSNLLEAPTFKASHVNQSIGVIDMLKRDRFELLSAYLDGEVTAAEKRQVEEWLRTEPEVQCLYARLLKLRQELRTLPVPQEQSVEQTIGQVFERLNNRARLTVIGGGAIAALFVGVISGIFPTNRPLQIAQAPESVTPAGETLMVGLNTPVVEIPKAAVAERENASHRSKNSVN